MPITRTPIIDDDGTGTTGTAIDNAWKQQLYDQIDGVVASNTSGVVAVVNGGSNVFDVALPTPRPFTYMKCDPTSADLTIRSITASPYRLGDAVLIENIGTYTVWLQHNYGSLQEFSLYNRVTSGATPLAPGGSAIYMQDSLWRLAQHDQGRMIRVPYAASNYTAMNGGPWTVPSTAIVEHDYWLQGDVLTVHMTLGGSAASTTLSTASTILRVTGFPWSMIYGVLPGMFYQGAWTALAVDTADTQKFMQFNMSFAAGALYLCFHGSVHVT